MTTAEEWEGEDAAMEARDAWEDDEAQRHIQLIRLRRHALEDFAATLPALLAAAPSDEVRARIQPHADKLDDFLRNFHMNNLNEMERLQQKIQELTQPGPHPLSPLPTAHPERSEAQSKDSQERESGSEAIQAGP